MAASELSSEQMQAKITAARREAESLKDKIKRRKDELADTTCKLFPVPVMLFRSAIPSRSMTFVTPLAKPPLTTTGGSLPSAKATHHALPSSKRSG